MKSLYEFYEQEFLNESYQLFETKEGDKILVQID